MPVSRRVTAALRQADEQTLNRVMLLLDTPSTDTRGITCPQDAFNVLFPILGGLEDERLVVLGLNRRQQLLGPPKVLTVGSDRFTVVDPKQIFRWALKLPRGGASAIIMAHNHPSGDPKPSQQDIDVTRRVVEAGRTLGIRLVDHLVIGGSSFTSIAEQGHLPVWGEQQGWTA